MTNNCACRQFSERFLDADLDHHRYGAETIHDHSFARKAKHRLVLWFTGIFMRLARYAPDSWLNDEPLIEADDLERVKPFYSQDWEDCLAYVEQQSLRLGVTRNFSQTQECLTYDFL